MKVENGNITLNAKEKRELGLEGLPEFLGKGNQLADYLMDPETGVGVKKEKNYISISSTNTISASENPYNVTVTNNLVTDTVIYKASNKLNVYYKPPFNFENHFENNPQLLNHKLYALQTLEHSVVLSLWNDVYDPIVVKVNDEVVGVNSIAVDSQGNFIESNSGYNIVVPPNTFITDIPEHQYYQLAVLGKWNDQGKARIMLKVPVESEV